ncbi:MAG: redoxin domain-containing protein [Pyrinomonadaceae bacterium]
MLKKIISAIFILVTASLAVAQTTPAPSPTPARPAAPAPPKTHLKVGDAAPDFTLPSTIVGADSRTVRYKLSDLKGKKNVVLAFYVLAFTGG